MFPVASMCIVALHPLFPKAALGVPGQSPLTLCAGLSAMLLLLSPGLSFTVFSPFFFSFAASIKHFCIFVCHLLC